MDNLCKFGCGNKGIKQFKNGEWCCSESRNQCPSLRDKNRFGNTGRIQTNETRNKISKSNTGVPKERPKLIKNEEGLLCEYGCGNLAVYQYSGGKLCCSDMQYRCPEQCRKNKDRLVEQFKDPERVERLKISVLKSWEDPERAIKNTIGIKRFLEKETEEEKNTRLKKLRETKKTEKHKKIMSNAALEFWKREDYIKNRAAAMEKLLEDPIYHEKLVQRIRKFHEDNPGIFAMEKNANWKGGLSFEQYPPEFNLNTKKLIQKRDDHKCMNPTCWNKQTRLTIHHIDYNKKNCNEKNLITLCNSCNARANGNREFWKILYEKIILKIYKIISDEKTKKSNGIILWEF
jgi:hypothetical protein